MDDKIMNGMELTDDALQDISGGAGSSSISENIRSSLRGTRCADCRNKRLEMDGRPTSTSRDGIVNITVYCPDCGRRMLYNYAIADGSLNFVSFLN